MRRKPEFRVVGVQDDGKRIVITKSTTREIAEKIVKLMTPGSTFTELLIEEDGDDN